MLDLATFWVWTSDPGDFFSKLIKKISKLFKKKIQINQNKFQINQKKIQTYQPYSQNMMKLIIDIVNYKGNTQKS